jgi:glycosyltransferase involved in cell wall biosynthesis
MRYTLLLVHAWPSTENPASSQFIYQDALVLSEIVDLDIILISDSNENWYMSGFKNFTVINHQASLNLKNITKIYKEIKKYIKTIKDQKVYLVTVFPETSFFGFLIRRNFKFWIHFEHSILASKNKKIINLYFPDRAQKLKQFIKSFVYKVLLRFTHDITVPSQYLANNFLLKRKQVHVIQNHINSYQIQILQNAKSKKKFNSAIFIGGLNSGKDPVLAIKIFEQLKKKGLVNNLRIYGEGELIDTVFSMVKSSEFSHDIEIHGFVNSNESFEALAKSSFLILPTKYETFGIIILSAIISETVVITAGEGGHLELLDGKEYIYIRESNNFESELIGQINQMNFKKITDQANTVLPKFTEEEKKLNYLSLFNY